MRLRAALAVMPLVSCLVAWAQEQMPGSGSTGSVLRASLVLVQAKNPKALQVGKLLVASPDLGDPNFAHSVVVLVRYDPQGAVGLVLNRRTEIPLSRVLEDIKAAKGSSDPVYLGGPVEAPSLFALLHAKTKPEGVEQILRDVYLISSKALFEQTISARPGPTILHVYMGYSGWSREQLKKEVDLGAWYVFPGDVETIFNSDPDSLWFQMIRKTGLKFTKGEPAKSAPSMRAAR